MRPLGRAERRVRQTLFVCSFWVKIKVQKNWWLKTTITISSSPFLGAGNSGWDPLSSSSASLSSYYSRLAVSCQAARYLCVWAVAGWGHPATHFSYSAGQPRLAYRVVGQGSKKQQENNAQTLYKSLFASGCYSPILQSKSNPDSKGGGTTSSHSGRRGKPLWLLFFELTLYLEVSERESDSEGQDFLSPICHRPLLILFPSSRIEIFSQSILKMEQKISQPQRLIP